MSVTQLDNLRRKGVFYQHDAPVWARNIWPRPESFDWFLKAHREQLMQRGALVRLGRDYFVDIAVFPDVAAEVLGVTHGAGASKQ